MTNPRNKTRGFTLIELLVVISIIGLLSSIVLAAVTSARNKALDARVTSDLVSLRNAAELYRTQFGYYHNGDNGVGPVYGQDPITGEPGEGYCNPDFILSDLYKGNTIMMDIRNLTGLATETTQLDELRNLWCGTDQNSYAIYARLPSTLNNYPPYKFVCLDSSGITKVTSFVYLPTQLDNPAMQIMNQSSPYFCK